MNLYLIGMMATGKTSVGQIIAQKSGLQFFDSDEEIEKSTGLTINEIFRSKGESYFRKLEKSFVEKGHPKNDSIISCGGGLCMQRGILEKIKSLGFVVCLWAEPQTIFERTYSNTDRPLIAVEDPLNEIKKLIRNRRDRYLKAHQVIPTAGNSMDFLANLILDHFKKYKENLS